MKRLLASFLVACFITVCYGQPDLRNGYVITHAHDTLAGLIDYRVGSAPNNTQYE